MFNALPALRLTAVATLRLATVLTLACFYSPRPTQSLKSKFLSVKLEKLRRQVRVFAGRTGKIILLTCSVAIGGSLTQLICLMSLLQNPRLLGIQKPEFSIKRERTFLSGDTHPSRERSDRRERK